jgi:hypothetical protein
VSFAAALVYIFVVREPIAERPDTAAAATLA